MNKGLISVFTLLACLLLPLTVFPEGEIYKVVDADGNVTFTDQPPHTGAKPMDLPPLSVIQTDISVPGTPAEAVPDESEPLTPRELRKQFSDFGITQPQPEQTFWGTENAVVVSWGSSRPIPPELSVMLYVDGAPQKAPPAGAVSLTLERGEHRVHAELRDQNNRRIISSPTVTFFVRQHSTNFNRPAVGPRN